jgi:hypothetical protein
MQPPRVAVRRARAPATSPHALQPPDSTSCARATASRAKGKREGGAAGGAGGATFFGSLPSQPR